MKDKFSGKVHILGTEYDIEVCSREEDPELEGLSGYCKYYDKYISILDFDSVPDYAEQSEKMRNDAQREVLRHEITHAFLMESGLQDETSGTDCWSSNEEMIDWIALQGPKMVDAWKEAKAL